MDDDPQTQARAEGYSWGDIDAHISQASTEAADQGYSQAEIDQHLGYANPAPFQDRSLASWTSHLGNDDQTLASVENAEPVDLTANPNYRADYADALLNREVKGPRDFADQYAAAALQAAHGPHGVDDNDQEEVKARLGVGAQAASSLADQLPSSRDVTDAALSLGGNLDMGLTKQALVDNWRKTGQSPIDAAIRAGYDPAFADQLFAPQAPTLDQLSQPARDKLDFFGLSLLAGNTEEAIWKGKSPAEVAAAFDIDLGTNYGLGLFGKYIAAPLLRMGGDAVKDFVGQAPSKIFDLKPDTPDVQTTVADAFKPVQPAAPALSLSPAEDVEGRFARHDVLDADGNKVASVQITRNEHAPEDVAPGTAHVDMIGTDEAFAKTADGDNAAANQFGPRAMRELARQYFEQNPAIDKLEGLRISGARGQANARDITVTRDQVLGPGKRFAEGATPAEKMQALARDGGEHDGSPDHFQRLAKDEDPATQELAKGYDQATGLYKWLGQTFGDLLKDESGALKLFSSPQQYAYGQASNAGNDYAQTAIRRLMGRGEQWRAHFVDQTFSGYKILAPFMKEFEDQLAKLPASTPMNTKVGNLYDYMEGRSLGAALHHDSPLAPVADAIRGVAQQTEAEIRKAVNDGVITHEGYYEDHFAHLWKNPKFDVDRALGAGKQGSGRSLNQREIMTMGDGINAGLEPKFANPIDAAIHNYSATMQYLQTARELKTAEQWGHVYWASSPANESDMAITGALAKRQRGPINEQLYATPGFARPWNNSFASTWNPPTKVSGFLDKLQYWANSATAAKLLFPGWHTIGMITESYTGQVAKLGEALMKGDFASAAKFAAEFPIAPITAMRKGAKVIDDYAKMVNDPVINFMRDANARFGKRQDIYRMSSQPTIQDSIARGALGSDLMGNLKSVLGDPRTETKPWRAVAALWRTPEYFASELGRVLNSVTAPLWDHVIPNLKAGVTYDRTRVFLENNKLASLGKVQQRVRQIVDDTDNRMGELNQNNLFWPQWTKRVLNGIGISIPSWVYGSLRWMGAAVGVNTDRMLAGRMPFEWNPAATTSLLSFAVAQAGTNALYQYAKTGQMPWQTDTPLRDFIAPRTGGKTPKSGVPERAVLPGLTKEFFDVAKMVWGGIDGGFAGGVQALWKYSEAKLNPLAQTAIALVTGKDNLDQHIAQKPGGWDRFLKEQFLPIAASQNATKNTGFNSVERTLGLRAAPNMIQDWDRFTGINEWLKSKWTKEALQTERSIQSNYVTPTVDLPPSGGGRHKPTGDKAMDAFISSPQNRRNQAITRQRSSGGRRRSGAIDDYSYKPSR